MCVCLGLLPCLLPLLQVEKVLDSTVGAVVGAGWRTCLMSIEGSGVRQELETAAKGSLGVIFAKEAELKEQLKAAVRQAAPSLPPLPLSSPSLLSLPLLLPSLPPFLPSSLPPLPPFLPSLPPALHISPPPSLTPFVLPALPPSQLQLDPLVATPLSKLAAPIVKPVCDALLPPIVAAYTELCVAYNLQQRKVNSNASDMGKFVAAMKAFVRDIRYP